MPGAFAYHLQSYSAATVRSASNHWVGPLLAKGATISFGSVDEPYLAGTPNVAVFLDRLVYRRYTFAEAAYTSQASLSWQTTVVGDPLYCPFAQPPDVLHLKLERENSPLVAWSHLRVIGLNQATGLPVPEMLKYLEEIPTTKTSAILMEKVGDLHLSEKRLSAAAEAYSTAVKLSPSPQQKIRLLLAMGELQTLLGREQDAFNTYKQLVTDAPDYPNASMVYLQLAALARKLGKTDEAEKLGKPADQPGK
jgi:tetratricopeptide (TPR) repeat protein